MKRKNYSTIERNEGEEEGKEKIVFCRNLTNKKAHKTIRQPKN